MKALAKLTLTLRMKDKRDDGFNNLEAFTVFLQDVFDEIELVENSDYELTINGSSALDPKDRSNLILRAKDLFEKKYTGLGDKKVFNTIGFKLEKQIPIAAGLGGGSADAATTLRLLNNYFKEPFSENELADMSAEIGSDIPACVFSKALWMKGRGERIEPIEEFNAEDIYVLIVTPQIECSTPKVFYEYESLNRPEDLGVEVNLGVGLPSNLHNDLSLAANSLYPELMSFKDRLEREIDRPLFLAGSGSTLFTLGRVDEIVDMSSEIKRSSFWEELRFISTSYIC